MKQVLGYARVSTERQALTHSLEHQKARLIDAGAEIIYYDVESGGNASRQNLDKMLDLIREDKVDKVFATKWDRVTRNLELYLEIKAIVQKHNTKLVFLDGGEADFKTAVGKLSSLIQVAFAIHEREKIVERINEGFEGRRKREVAWIRPPWGYIILNEKYELDHQEITHRLPPHIANKFEDVKDEFDSSNKVVTLTKAKIAREFFDYFLAARSTTDLIRYISDKYDLKRGEDSSFTELNSFPLSSRGIKQWLQNPIFQGHTAYLKYKKNGGVKSSDEWEIHPNTHPEHRLITEQEGNEIKEILASNSKKFGHPAARFYLTGLVFCQKCGCSCTLRSGSAYSYYGCGGSSTVCDSGKGVRLFKIEKAIIAELVETAQRISQNSEPQMSSPEVKEIRQQIKNIEDISGSQFNSIFQEAINKLRKEEQYLLEKLDLVAHQILGYSVAGKINFWYTLNEMERRIFYEKLVKRVTILNGAVVSVQLKLDGG